MVDILKFRELFPKPDRKIREKGVFGVGTNDADYYVFKHLPDEIGVKTQHMCYYYQKWLNMLQRCYSETSQKRRPTYKGCTVCEEWHSFMAFRAWMITQEFLDMQLDKDFLSKDNKIYSPETCVFIPSTLNKFMNDCGASRGDCPIGVYWHKARKQFRAECRNPFTGKRKSLGYFDCKYEAHQKWVEYKIKIANQYIDIYLSKDFRIANRLYSFCLELLTSDDYRKFLDLHYNPAGLAIPPRKRVTRFK